MKTSRTSNIILSLAICLLAISACKREHMPAGSVTGYIKARVSSVGTKSMISSEKKELTQTIAMEGTDDMVLQEYVSDNLSQPFEDGYLGTKGTVIYNADVCKTFTEFAMEGFLDNAGDIDCDDNNWPKVLEDGEYVKLVGDHYIRNGQAKYSNGNWNLTDGQNSYPWLLDINFTFWSYYPKDFSGATFSKLDDDHPRGSLTFNYTNPTAAANQKDLLFAYNNRGYSESEKDDFINIKFRHALADVYFDFSALTDRDITVKDISITDIFSVGTCSVVGGEADEEGTIYDEDVEDAFTWDPDTGSEETFTMVGADDHFLMIPQSIYGSEINITMIKGGVEMKSTATLKSTTWKAGKYYEYVLKFNGVDIEITDEVEGDIKSDLEISNTGTRDVYVRALIVGNWVNEAGEIISTWDPTNTVTGQFVPNIYTETLTDWVKSADGFFYYKHILEPEAVIPEDKNLFDTYTVNPAGKPKYQRSGEHLEINVVSQAVLVDNDKAAITKAWGASAAGYVDDPENEE